MVFGPPYFISLYGMLSIPGNFLFFILSIASCLQLLYFRQCCCYCCCIRRCSGIHFWRVQISTFTAFIYISSFTFFFLSLFYGICRIHYIYSAASSAKTKFVIMTYQVMYTISYFHLEGSFKKIQTTFISSGKFAKRQSSNLKKLNNRPTTIDHNFSQPRGW